MCTTKAMCIVWLNFLLWTIHDGAVEKHEHDFHKGLIKYTVKRTCYDGLGKF